MSGRRQTKEDREWSKTVRARAGNRCELCGAEKYLNAHHILPKERYKEYRYELTNGISLCPSCHKWGKYSAHRNPIFFAEKLKEKYIYRYEWVIAHL